MAKTPIMINAWLEAGIHARIDVNDLPFYKLPLRSGPFSANGGLNQLLVPGENVVDLQILAGPTEAPPKATPSQHEIVSITIFVVTDPNTRPIGADIIHKVAFPEIWKDEPVEKRRLPYRHVFKFTPPCEVFTPAYLSAPVETFDCDGTPDLRDAVTQIHDALEAGDADRFIDLVSLKLEEKSRAYEGATEGLISTQRQRFTEFFRNGLDVKPLGDFSEIHFRPRVGGRVCEVVRWDGLPLLHAINSNDKSDQFKGNLLLTRHNDAWRAF